MGRTVAITAAISLLSSVTPGEAASGWDERCEQLKQVDWSDYEAWGAAIHRIEEQRILPNGEHRGDPTDPDAITSVIKQLEALVQPDRLSEGVRLQLRELGDADINFIHLPRSNLYFFGNKQGSGDCSYNIWAVGSGGTIVSIDTPPFDLDVCNASTAFGTVNGEALVVQIQYAGMPIDLGGPVSVIAAAAEPGRWKNFCVITVPVSP